MLHVAQAKLTWRWPLQVFGIYRAALQGLLILVLKLWSFPKPGVLFGGVSVIRIVVFVSGSGYGTGSTVNVSQRQDTVRLGITPKCDLQSITQNYKVPGAEAQKGPVTANLLATCQGCLQDIWQINSQDAIMLYRCPLELHLWTRLSNELL